jgi:hypothetical protein
MTGFVQRAFAKFNAPSYANYKEPLNLVKFTARLKGSLFALNFAMMPSPFV